jgi:hypothetical protein
MRRNEKAGKIEMKIEMIGLVSQQSLRSVRLTERFCHIYSTHISYSHSLRISFIQPVDKHTSATAIIIRSGQYEGNC